MAKGPMSTPRRPAPRSIGTPTMPTALRWRSRPRTVSPRGLSCWRGFTGFIVIEAAACFAAQITRGDHLAQERWRGEARVFELVEQDVGDVQRRVQTDEVEQSERAHPVAGAEHHAEIDVFARGEALLEQAHRFTQVRDQQKVDNKPSTILADN